MGLTDPGNVGDANALAVEERAPAPARRVELTGHRIVDDTSRDLARFLQRDQGRPDGDAADEVLGPVDGIDDEAPLPPNSSPRNPWSGKARRRISTITCSASRSAWVTGVRSGLIVTSKPLR